MVRNVLGSLLAALGATAALWSPFRAWYDSRLGRDIRFEDLFTGITGQSADLFVSMLLPMAVGALIALIGILLRSRLTVACAGVVVLAFTTLWMVRQGQAVGSLTAGGRGLGIGVAMAFGGGLLLLFGALVMRGRRRRSGGRHRHDHPEAYPRDEYGRDEYGPHDSWPGELRDDQPPGGPGGPGPGQTPGGPGPGHPPGGPAGPGPGQTPPHGSPGPPDRDSTRSMPPVRPPVRPPPPPPDPRNPGGRPPTG